MPTLANRTPRPLRAARRTSSSTMRLETRRRRYRSVRLAGDFLRLGRGRAARVDHSVPVRRCVLHIVGLALSGAAFRGQNTATVNVFEIAVWKLVVRLGVLGLGVVHAEVPVGIFCKTVLRYELVLGAGRGLGLAPSVALVEYETTSLD